MSDITLCVIIIEIGDDCGPLSSLSYTAPKYTMDEGNGLVPLVLDQGEPTKVKGQRMSKPLTVETYEVEECSVERSGRKGADGEPKKVNFISGNPFNEVTKGILHLYKENESTPWDNSDNSRSEMLCMLAVPATMSCRDLIQFLAPFQTEVERIKIIRDGSPNQYMVLIKFHEQRGADALYNAFNGVNFNSIEDDVCHLAYVSRVETFKESEGAGLPLVGHTELPTCPVCLERMDESVEGILTILCNHTFHSHCLAKWVDSSCPVCRYVQTPEMVANNQCSECGSSESLWICLICGHVGCGRYVQGHAYKHFCETSHCYAIQPTNNRVWDYVGDNFVHRLLQNKTDGKLVEVSGASRASQNDCEKSEDKSDSLQLEFTYILTTQLESQRSFFEDKLNLSKMEMMKEVQELKESLLQSVQSSRDLEEKFNSALKEKAALERKLTVANQRLTKALSELKEEKDMNKCLADDKQKWQEMVANTKKKHDEYVQSTSNEILDLKEQLRDIMFFLEAQKKIEESPLQQELQEGQVFVETAQPSSSTSAKGGRRNKKKGPVT